MDGLWCRTAVTASKPDAAKIVEEPIAAEIVEEPKGDVELPWVIKPTACNPRSPLALCPHPLAGPVPRSIGASDADRVEVGRRAMPLL